MNEDSVAKVYWSDNVRYADLINGIAFEGKQVVKPEHLQELDSQTGNETGPEMVQKRRMTKYRDLIRKTAFGINFAIVGLENQQKVHTR